jgi:protein-disulfide isomerase
MKQFCILVMLALGGVAFPALPATTQKDMDEIVKRLEESGALDRAVDRAIERYLTRQRDAQRKQQEASAAQRSALSQNARKPDPARDHMLGNPVAEVTIIEYSDFECPYCKAFHPTPREVVKRLGGKVNLVWRHFPLDFHNPAAQKEAEASICAAKLGGNDAFWKYADGIMQRTGSNGQGMRPANAEDPLVSLARELKLDIAAFQRCLESGAGRTQIAEDQRDGANAGINGTPGVIVRNNKTGKTVAISGAVPVEALESQTRAVLSSK